MMNWVQIYNLLFISINEQETNNYFSGPRFIKLIQEFDNTFSSYTRFIEERQIAGKSTSRRDYFYDIFLSFSESRRISILNRILSEIGAEKRGEVQEIRSLLHGSSLKPSAVIPQDLWNADKLNEILETIDYAISSGDLNRSVTLTYTCMEGFLKAFHKEKIKDQPVPGEIVKLTKAVKEFLKRQDFDGIPNEVINVVTHITHAIDKARNKFSESHFAEGAPRWMALYLRDLLNTQIRLLLSFM